MVRCSEEIGVDKTEGKGVILNTALVCVWIVVGVGGESQGVLDCECYPRDRDDEVGYEAGAEIALWGLLVRLKKRRP